MTTKDNNLVIGIVGPCGSGKSTLVANLRNLQLPCKLHHIAQEHSFVPDMWKRLIRPDILIFLNASFEVCNSRRILDWTYDDYLEQHRRLANARQNADLYIDTDLLEPDEVVKKVLDFLNTHW